MVSLLLVLVERCAPCHWDHLSELLLATALLAQCASWLMLHGGGAGAFWQAAAAPHDKCGVQRVCAILQQ